MKKVTYPALAIAVALILSYLENLLPVFIPVPGCKLGLSNMAVLFAVLYLGTGPACIVLCAKALLPALLFGSLSALPFSLAGGLLSFLVVLCMKPFLGKGVSLLGLSVLSAAAHNTGQILAARVVMGSGAVFSYLPLLLLLSIPMGLLTGFVCTLVFKNLQNNRLLRCSYDL